MDRNVEHYVDRIKAIAKGDPEYSRLYQDSIRMERQYEQVLLHLTDEQQDIIWQFVFQCEAMSNRMLELACEQIAEK